MATLVQGYYCLCHTHHQCHENSKCMLVKIVVLSKKLSISFKKAGTCKAHELKSSYTYLMIAFQIKVHWYDYL